MSDVKARVVEILGEWFPATSQVPSDLADRLDAAGLLASTDLLSAQAEVARLREALKPFADAFEKGLWHYTEHEDKEKWFAFHDLNSITPPGLVMGDYRRAHEALAPKDPT